MVSFGDVIVLIHVDAELYFFQDDLLLVLFGRPFLLFLLVEELAIVHDAANRWHRSGRNLYQVKTLLAGLSRCILRRHNTKLFAVRANHAYFACANPLIHLNKAFIYAILLNPSGKLTLLVELRGAPHKWQDFKIIASLVSLRSKPLKDHGRPQGSSASCQAAQRASRLRGESATHWFSCFRAPG